MNSLPEEGSLEEARPQEITLKGLLTHWYHKYVEHQFEKSFVVVTLLAIIGIGYFVDNKLAFINLLYIPVFLAAFLVGTRVAVLGAVFSFLVVVLAAVLDPDSFFSDQTNWNLISHILAWGCFLVLTGAFVGRLNESLSERYRKSQELVSQLTQKSEELQKAEGELMKTNQDLELKTRTIENLKEKVEAVLYSTMDPEVARLVVNRQIGNEKKLVTVLFADLAGFTTYSEQKQPELVIEELNEYFNILEPIIGRFRGHLDKFIGDGLMAEFGTPLFLEQHALQGVLAAIDMQERVGEARLPLKMRLGLATGTSIMGLVGSQRRKSYTAFGDTVNLAQRLEMLCPPGGILIDEITHKRVSHFINAKRFRTGQDEDDTQKLETQLANLESDIAAGRTKSEDIIQAGRLAAQLGDMKRALGHFKNAMQHLSARRSEIERHIADAVLHDDERINIKVKGRKMRVAAYEVIGLLDPLVDPNRIPPSLYEKYRSIEPRVAIPAVSILPIEALDASLGHARCTALIAYAIADAMNVGSDVKETVLLAGHLHHVGKKFIPDHLLNRNEADQDLQVLSGHVLEAKRVISEMGLAVSDLVLEAIHHHHEVYSGGGYPDGLTGESIPLTSRILGVASHYVNLTSWNPHREAWNQKAALNELKRGAEAEKHDPKVVEALLRLMEAHPRESSGTPV